MVLRLCVLLWERAGRASDLTEFEDAVLALLPNHGGKLLSRHTVIERNNGDPFEVQLIEMPDDAALTAYMEDPKRGELARRHDRDAIIARTEVLRLEQRSPPLG